MRQNLHIEIARTDNPEFSSMNRTSCASICDVLKRHYSHVGVTMIDRISDLDALVAKDPDLVFLGMKRIPAADYADDIWLSEYLASRGIEFIGSPSTAVEFELNKQHAKTVVQRAGLPTAEFFTSLPGEHVDRASLPLDFPLFVKPLHSGGGEGIAADSVVRTYAEFKHKISSIHTKFRSASLVEQYLSGREFSVAILGNAGHDQLIMPIEIVTGANAAGDRVLGYTVKNNPELERVTAIANVATRYLISTLAKNIFEALGARDVGRIDIRMDADGDGHFLEANLVPGLSTDNSYFFDAYRLNQGGNYEDMILRIVEVGLGTDESAAPVQFPELVAGA